MKLTTMFKDLAQSLTSEPATVPFPNPGAKEVGRLRGQLHWHPENCTGCQLCVKDCPSDAIQLFVIDKASKQFVMHYDIGRCTFCAQCVQNCRFDCLEMVSDEWALSDNSKGNFAVFYGDEDHVKQVVAESVTGNSSSNG